MYRHHYCYRYSTCINIILISIAFYYFNMWNIGIRMSKDQNTCTVALIKLPKFIVIRNCYQNLLSVCSFFMYYYCVQAVGYKRRAKLLKEDLIMVGQS